MLLHPRVHDQGLPGTTCAARLGWPEAHHNAMSMLYSDCSVADMVEHPTVGAFCWAMHPRHPKQAGAAGFQAPISCPGQS